MEKLIRLIWLLLVCMCQGMPIMSELGPEHELVARTLVSKSSWGVLTTVDPDGFPFGNVASFAEIYGVPYFFLAITKDLTGINALRNSAASFATSPYLDQGSTHYNGTVVQGPQSPICSQITLGGKLLPVEKNPKEEAVAKVVFFRSHPQFRDLPAFLQSDFKIFKLVVKSIILVDACAEPVEIPVDKYFSAT